MSRTTDEAVFLRKLVEKIRNIRLTRQFTLTEEERTRKLINSFRLVNTWNSTIRNRLNKLITDTRDAIKKNKSNESQLMEINKIKDTLENALRLLYNFGSYEIRLVLRDNDIDEIAMWLYDSVKHVTPDDVVNHVIRKYSNQITLKTNPDFYEFKPNIDREIDEILDDTSELNEELENKFEELSNTITNKNFVYLCAQNAENCTINATFHMLMNYAIMSGKINVTNRSFGSEEFNRVKELIKEYMSSWYNYLHDTVMDGDRKKTKYKNYVKVHNQQIKTILDAIVKNNKLQLQYIVYYYLLIHIWIYCQCLTETLANGVVLRPFSDFKLSHSYKELDDEQTRESHYDVKYIRNASDGIPSTFRRSNRISNIILREFWIKLGNSFDTEYIKNINENKISKAKTDILFGDLKYMGINFNGYLNSHGIYEKCLIKGYNSGHADVMYIEKTESETESKTEKFLINDEFKFADTHDKNKLNFRHIVAGIYVAEKDPNSIEKVGYESKTQITSPSFYVPSAMFFNGGAIVSLLIVICIVAIVVCVVIYVHDHYWFKSTKTINNEQK